LQPGDFKKASATVASKSGISLAYLDIDTEEHATRFIKDLFHNGLVAAVHDVVNSRTMSYRKLLACKILIPRCWGVLLSG